MQDADKVMEYAADYPGHGFVDAAGVAGPGRELMQEKQERQKVNGRFMILRYFMVLAGLILAATVGSSMAAEIGTADGVS